ncbi:hypothetical protein RJ639_005257 [Escallonia herrerae]|uniref:Uncharacterized protein n=1 Tax=Escallonia herrerae TaxID=1293975 RepID=A0AA88W689_9ASTE|nr:hypothetical protein RJ639_005257 [Escallonia herrerae]
MAKSPETEHPVKAFGWAARDASGVLSPFSFSRRETGEEDVRFKVLYCGICHSDLHNIRSDWGMSKYPLVPGHEVVGVVTEVGSKVNKVKVGDNVGVGCMVGSCNSCDCCAEDLENYCPRMLLIYGSIYYDQTMTYGGYSDSLVCAEHFIVQWPANLPLDAGAPLLGTMDGIIDTVSADHPMPPLIDLLKCHATLVLVGAPNKPLEIELVPLLMGRKTVAGSCIGGMKETQEMIYFAAKHDIKADVEVIPVDYVNTAMERLAKGDVKYRFVIDVGSTLKTA